MRDFNDDVHLDICQNIEVGLRIQYENLPDLTDRYCALGLDNAVIAIKQQFGFAKNEHVSDNILIAGIIEWCVDIGVERIGKVNGLTLKEYVDRIVKIRKSVIRHSEYGTRGYYDFIRNFV